MARLQFLRSALVSGASVAALANPAAAKQFDIPRGDLAMALSAYTQQAGVQIVYSDDEVRGRHTRGAHGNYTELAALTEILRGTGFTTQSLPASAIAIIPEPEQPKRRAETIELAAAAPGGGVAGVETVVVTAEKKTENIQQVPIAVSAFSQQQLTERQIAGGPDLVKEVPNLTFSKTNFTGYNLEIRGIGTQAISVTTDPAVAVAFNDIPFIRNHFFEQEFFDVQDVEVLRGPQGTLYGRNATAGVVNLKSALPTDQYEAMMSADMGNYSNRRLEGMLNIPIVGDKLDIRFAGEWTKRDGYTEDTTLDTPVDGRDLWSTRMTIGWKPSSDVQTYFVWEHFSEDDDRLRSGKQLCKTDYGPGFVPTPGLGLSSIGYDVINGVQKTVGASSSYLTLTMDPGDYFSQGCLPNVSLYSPQAFEAPLGFTLPYALGAVALGYAQPINPYQGVTQSTNLRDIESAILPHYIAKNDTLEYNANWNVTPELALASQTGYNNDYLWSTEDYNRFGATPGYWIPDGRGINSNGVFCDPQLGCSNTLIVQDLSTEHAWQFSQEFRVSSNFSGPFNFTAGANYLHYETVEKYYVFSNALTLINSDGTGVTFYPGFGSLPFGYQYDPIGGEGYLVTHGYIDPNPLSNLDDEGHNYFLSQNPYVLNSYAIFTDANYDVTKDLKLIAGFRWTVDQKHFLEIPSWVADEGYGYPVTGELNQTWERPTGRAVLNWTPQLDFSDQTLIYGSYAHGYKAGGANPPPAIFPSESCGANVTLGNDCVDVSPVHPLTFKPEYIEAFELGTKNTLFNGALTLNGDVFYYNYTGYQISEIVDRTAINTNYNAHIEGAELESNWEPVAGLKFSFAGGYENSGLAGGTEEVDLMDRTAGVPGWYVFKPFINEASNCIFPGYVAQLFTRATPSVGAQAIGYCAIAYQLGLDPVTTAPYVANPFPGYAGFNPATAPNDGAGFSKNLAGNQLPNAPHFTASLTAEYTMPVSDDWAATLHTDFYWQSQQWARVFEDPIDKIHPYENTNVSLILTSANGWQVMAYVKNVFNVTAITGTFLNSDDTGLTTNVFLTDPRLYGIRVTKHLDENDGFWGSDYSGFDIYKWLFADADNAKPPLWVELGGAFNQLDDAQQPLTPPFFSDFVSPLHDPVSVEHSPHSDFDYEAKVSFEPDDSDWVFAASVRYGRAARNNHVHQSHPLGMLHESVFGQQIYGTHLNARYLDAFASSNESHEIFDFTAGKDIGLGMLGLEGSSQISGGLRFVQFNQSSGFSIHADPDYVFNELGPKYQHKFFAEENAKRSFHGVGPTMSWNASAPVSDSTETGGVGFDWGLNGALLFGRQIARVQHQTKGSYSCLPLLNGGCHQSVNATKSNFPAVQTGYQRTANPVRRRTVAVPNIGAFAGVSWRYQNAKVSFGYRADEFFGAMDGGIDVHKSENIGFFGPYANISIGLGG